jgi:hypothetical protein
MLLNSKTDFKKGCGYSEALFIFLDSDQAQYCWASVLSKVQLNFILAESVVL